jgi:23S rRNA (pseudouridine1915-N3)-methyltransferase
VKLQVVEIGEEKRSSSASPTDGPVAMEKEGDRILAAIPKGSFVIALDVKGQGRSSAELAALFRQWELAGQNQLAFVIGGDLGLSPAVLSRSDLRLSLSPLTFTHQMVRFILLEQLYRACKINHGEPYHK